MVTGDDYYALIVHSVMVPGTGLATACRSVDGWRKLLLAAYEHEIWFVGVFLADLYILLSGCIVLYCAVRVRIAYISRLPTWLWLVRCCNALY